MTSPTSITDALAALSMEEEGSSLLEEILSSSTKVLVCASSFLDEKALLRLGATCHEFRSIILDDIDSVWRNLFDKRWPNHKIKSIDEGDWREEFTTRFTIQSLQQDELTQSICSIIASRESVIDTLVSYHSQLKLDPALLYLSVSILERYMATKPKNGLKTVTGLWVAANVQRGRDDVDLDVDEFARIGFCTTQEILDQEKQIREELEPNLSPPTSYNFLKLFLSLVKVSPMMTHAATYYLEVSLVEKDLLKYRASLVCASAIILAVNNPDIYFHQNGECPPESLPGLPDVLMEYTGFCQDELMECMTLIAKAVREPVIFTDNVNEGATSLMQLRKTKEKYKKEEFLFVSTAIEPPSIRYIKEK